MQNPSLFTNIFGNATAFKSEDSYYNFQDSVRNRITRHYAPVEFTKYPSSNPQGQRIFTKFEVNLEKWTKLDDIYISLVGDVSQVTVSGVATYVGTNWAVGRLPQQPFTVAQCCQQVKIKINNVELTNDTNFWSCLPGFVATFNKDLQALETRAGVPYQKLIQSGFLSRNLNVFTFGFDTEFDKSPCVINSGRNTFLIPLKIFSNFFNQPYILPPGVKIQVEFYFLHSDMHRFFSITAPGSSWVENSPGNDQGTTFRLLLAFANLQLTYYDISSNLSNEFMSLWKVNPWTNRYFDVNLLAFPSLMRITENTLYQRRLEIDSPINSVLMAFLAPEFTINTSGFEPTVFTFIPSNNYLFATYNSGAKRARLSLIPFQFEYLRIYLEDNAEPILDFGSTNQDPTIIHSFLKQTTQNFFRTSPDQMPVDCSDIYGYRAAPFFLPLHSETFFNTNFGPLPKRASYLIDYKVSSISNQIDINQGYFMYFAHVKLSTLKIDNSLRAIKFDSPLYFDGNNITNNIERA